MRLAHVMPPVVFAVLATAAPAQGVVPGSEGKIAFDSTRDGNAEIYSMEANGGAQTPLTNNPASDQNPAVSPEGNRIAFASDRDGNLELYVMAFSGAGQTRLTNNPATDANATWSPNGDQIAFQTIRDGNNEIYKMNADGSNPVNLTNNANTDFRPNWSPDGTKIVFVSNRDGNQEIYSMNADGSGQTRLTNNTAVDAHPAWLSGGAQIVWVQTGDIWRMNADGSGQTQLTNTANNSDPAGSPEGRVVFRSSRTGNSEVFVMDANGGGQTNLTNNAAADAGPDWQGVNRAPTCANTTRTTPFNTATTIDVSCTDPDGNPLGYVHGGPGNGTLSGVTTISAASGISPFLQGSGTLRFTYTPRTDYFGSDAIAFLASDGRGGTSNVALLTVNTSAPPTPIAPAPVLAQNPPDVISFRFSPRRITVARGSTPTALVAAGGTFSYSLSAPARVRIEIERQSKGRRVRGTCRRSARRGTRCTVFQLKGTLTRNGSAGSNTVPFTGRIGRRALPAGSYVATITPFDATSCEAGVPRTTTFEVVRR
jgi:dipeptidyl aminopeptidase/acylaminoacyl peptidase